MPTLKAEKENLLAEKKERQEKYYSYRDQKKELDTIYANVHAALASFQAFTGVISMLLYIGKRLCHVLQIGELHFIGIGFALKKPWHTL